MKNTKLVIFDMDGLLIDSERGMWLVSEEYAYNKLGFKFDYDFALTLMGASLDITKKRIQEKYGKGLDVEEFYRIIHKNNLKIIQNNEIRLMKGARELLTHLKSKNIKMRIATSTYKELAEVILKNLGIYDFFEEIVTGDRVKHGKPSPDIYLLALGNDKKEETIIFEDAHNGASAAIAAGIDLILVPDLAPLTDEDKREAYKVIKDLSEAIDII